MKTRISVDVLDRKQARLLERGLQLPDVRAFAITMGVLHDLPTDRARQRVLMHLYDYVHDPANYPSDASASEPAAIDRETDPLPTT